MVSQDFRRDGVIVSVRKKTSSNEFNVAVRLKDGTLGGFYVQKSDIDIGALLPPEQSPDKKDASTSQIKQACIGRRVVVQQDGVAAGSPLWVLSLENDFDTAVKGRVFRDRGVTGHIALSGYATFKR